VSVFRFVITVLLHLQTAIEVFDSILC